MAYAEALAAAIVSDLADNPPPGALARVVIRWFDSPLYLTIHALGTEEDDVDPEDAWAPLEWENCDDEIERADRIVERPDVAAAGEALAATLEDEAFPCDPGSDLGVVPGPLVAAAQGVRAGCERAALPLAPHFAVGVAHFEGFGAEAGVRAANPPETWDLLVARGIEPVERPPLRRPERGDYSSGSGRFSPGHTPVRYFQPCAPCRSTMTRVVLKIRPCSAAAVMTLTQSASSVVALGGSWSSILVQTKLNSRLPRSAARTPMMIPKGL